MEEPVNDKINVLETEQAAPGNNDRWNTRFLFKFPDGTKVICLCSYSIYTDWSKIVNLKTKAYVKGESETFEIKNGNLLEVIEVKAKRLLDKQVREKGEKIKKERELEEAKKTSIEDERAHTEDKLLDLVSPSIETALKNLKACGDKIEVLSYKVSDEPPEIFAKGARGTPLYWFKRTLAHATIKLKNGDVVEYHERIDLNYLTPESKRREKRFAKQIIYEKQTIEEDEVLKPFFKAVTEYIEKGCST